MARVCMAQDATEHAAACEDHGCCHVVWAAAASDEALCHMDGSCSPNITTTMAAPLAYTSP